MPGSARREAVSCRALVRQGSHSTSRANNTADNRLSPCPEGATEPRHCRVAALDKGPAIVFKLRLALARLGGSEPGNITLKEYQYSFSLLAIFLDVFFGFVHTAQPFFLA